MVDTVGTAGGGDHFWPAPVERRYLVFLRRAVRIGIAAVLVAAAVTVAGPVTSASAAPTGLVTFIDNFLAPPGTEGTGTVRCPAGTKIINSGVDDGQLIGQNIFNDYSGAMVTARVTGPRQQFTAYAVCGVWEFGADPSLPIRVGSPFGPHPSNLKFGTVTCPDGYYPFAGVSGFSQGTPGAALYVSSITADGKGWTVAGRMDSLDGNIVGIIHCAPRTTTTTVAAAVVSADSGLAAVARCPAGYTVVVGGASLLLPNGQPAAGSITTSKPGRGTWIAIGNSTAPGATLTSRAMCVI